MYPNLYVLLVGPPGVRKSTGIKITANRLKKATGIRFAPDDTAGQRQGLITAMSDDMELDPDVQALKNGSAGFELDDLLNLQIKVDIRDKHVMFASASEFSSFIGTNSREMVKFLNKVWDGEDYEYRLKSERKVLEAPLLSFIGGTTPTNLSEDLPTNAIGQGFTSRIIFVYANKRYKPVPDPPPFDAEIEAKIEATYKELFYNVSGPLSKTPDAHGRILSLYDYDTKIQDTRFVYYVERRQQHLLKVSVILTAIRGSKTIEFQDVEEAHQLLVETEKYMSDALGEFGLSPFAIAKQQMLEFIAQAGEAVSEQILWSMMNRMFAKRVDFSNALADLRASGKIAQVDTKRGVAFMYRDTQLLQDALDGTTESQMKH